MEVVNSNLCFLPWIQWLCDPHFDKAQCLIGKVFSVKILDTPMDGIYAGHAVLKDKTHRIDAYFTKDSIDKFDREEQYFTGISFTEIVDGLVALTKYQIGKNPQKNPPDVYLKISAFNLLGADEFSPMIEENIPNTRNGMYLKDYNHQESESDDDNDSEFISLSGMLCCMEELEKLREETPTTKSSLNDQNMDTESSCNDITNDDTLEDDYTYTYAVLDKNVLINDPESYAQKMEFIQDQEFDFFLCRGIELELLPSDAEEISEEEYLELQDKGRSDRGRKIDEKLELLPSDAEEISEEEYLELQDKGRSDGGRKIVEKLKQLPSNGEEKSEEECLRMQDKVKSDEERKIDENLKLLVDEDSLEDGELEASQKIELERKIKVVENKTFIEPREGFEEGELEDSQMNTNVKPNEAKEHKENEENQILEPCLCERGISDSEKEFDKELETTELEIGKREAEKGIKKIVTEGKEKKEVETENKGNKQFISGATLAQAIHSKRAGQIMSTKSGRIYFYGKNKKRYLCSEVQPTCPVKTNLLQVAADNGDNILQVCDTERAAKDNISEKTQKLIRQYETNFNSEDTLDNQYLIMQQLISQNVTNEDENEFETAMEIIESGGHSLFEMSTEYDTAHSKSIVNGPQTEEDFLFLSENQTPDTEQQLTNQINKSKDTHINIEKQDYEKNSVSEDLIDFDLNSTVNRSRKQISNTSQQLSTIDRNTSENKSDGTKELIIPDGSDSSDTESWDGILNLTVNKSRNRISDTNKQPSTIDRNTSENKSDGTKELIIVDGYNSSDMNESPTKQISESHQRIVPEKNDAKNIDLETELQQQEMRDVAYIKRRQEELEWRNDPNVIIFPQAHSRLLLEMFDDEEEEFIYENTYMDVSQSTCTDSDSFEISALECTLNPNQHDKENKEITGKTLERENQENDEMTQDIENEEIIGKTLERENQENDEMTQDIENEEITGKTLERENQENDEMTQGIENKKITRILEREIQQTVDWSLDIENEKTTEMALDIENEENNKSIVNIEYEEVIEKTMERENQETCERVLDIENEEITGKTMERKNLETDKSLLDIENVENSETTLERENHNSETTHNKITEHSNTNDSYITKCNNQQNLITKGKRKLRCNSEELQMISDIEQTETFMQPAKKKKDFVENENEIKTISDENENSGSLYSKSGTVLSAKSNILNEECSQLAGPSNTNERTNNNLKTGELTLKDSGDLFLWCIEYLS